MSAHPSAWHRRDWLRATWAAACLARVGSAAAGADPVEQIKARARDTRLQPFETSETEHFVGVGDAPAAHRREALELCEAFALDYMVHFRGKGFTLDWPAAKLPVVILAGATSYAAFEKGFVDDAVGGHFDLDANWLVTFDFRDREQGMNRVEAAEARQNNTLALVHETFHQLSYNTGMLDRAVDTPLCLVEGLATYAETWRPARKDGVIGTFNRRRRGGLELAQRHGEPWIPAPSLLAQDKHLTDSKAQQVAYAESWMLAYKLLRVPARTAQLRDYLKAVQRANDPTKRIELATTHFGDLDKLDREIRRP